MAIVTVPPATNWIVVPLARPGVFTYRMLAEKVEINMTPLFAVVLESTIVPNVAPWGSMFWMSAPFRFRIFPVMERTPVLLKGLPIPERLMIPPAPINVPLLMIPFAFRVWAPFSDNVWLALTVIVEAVTEDPRLTVALLPLMDTVPRSCPAVLSVQVCVPLALKEVMPVPLV